MKIKQPKVRLFAFFTLFLTGCSSLMPSSVTQEQPWHFLPMAIPLQPTAQQEIKLARIEQLLVSQKLSKEDLARLYFERGLVSDSLGLRDLARLDFNRSLSLNPAQPDIFNILGIYYTQNGMYDEAYEAFDSTLELSKDHEYAERNRGIALYYGGRYALAERDLLTHFNQNPNDVYRALWLYLTELERYGDKKAKASLMARYEASNKKDWAWQIALYYLGKMSEQALFEQIVALSNNNFELAARLCESYFYLAKDFQAKGDIDSAIALYKLAMSGNVYEFVEHRYALLELTRIVEAASVPADIPNTEGS
jgi:lipoprotein NlpI